MMRKWTNREIDRSLQELGRLYDSTPEQSAVFEARIRREVIARYGLFNVSLSAAGRSNVSAPFGAGAIDVFGWFRGMLGALRPIAFVSAVIAVALGAVAVLRQFSAPAAPVGSEPRTTVATAYDAPVAPGSGAAVSVFAVAEVPPAVVLPATNLPPPRTPVRHLRPSAANPSPSVFSSWGSSVFSNNELLKQERSGKSLFNS